jgi:hypothetical protein
MIDLREYREGVLADLNRCKSDLEPLVSGGMVIGSRRDGGDWEDHTAETIQQHRHTIATYEMILADPDQRIAADRS